MTYSNEEEKYLNEEKRWKQIRHGLKLRSLNRSRRMHDATGVNLGAQSSMLILARHKGLEQVIPDSTKWTILTDSGKNECWNCEEHTIALYIWTP